MHDKPFRLESFCLDSLCLSVVAVYDPELDITIKTNNPTLQSSTEIDSSSSNSESTTPRTVRSLEKLISPKSNQNGEDNYRSEQDLSDWSAGKTTSMQYSPLSIMLSDQLLIRLNEKHLLNDNTLMFFSQRRCRLENVKINGKLAKISTSGLRILNQHTLQSLKLLNMSSINFFDLVDECLSQSTLQSLQLFDLTGTLRTTFFKRRPELNYRRHSESSTTGPSGNKSIDNSMVENPTNECTCTSSSNSTNTSNCGGWISPICKFVNLHTLIVAKTHFDNLALEQVCQNLHKLNFLNISHTSVTSLVPLLHIAGHLSVLIAQKPRFTNTDMTVGVLCSLGMLEILDISDYRKSTPQNANANNGLQQQAQFRDQDSDSCRLAVLFIKRMVETQKSLQHLKVFDISGVQANFEINVFSSFLRLHKKLEFFGLLMSNACYFDCILASSLKVTGEASKRQVFLALATYWLRDSFCARCMYNLYLLTEEAALSNFSDADKIFCIENIIKGLHANLSHLSVQMAGTACLYTFCKDAQTLQPKFIKMIVETSLEAIECHKHTLQLHKNVWLTLCNDHILQSGTFDMFRCCSAAMQSMVNCKNAQVTRITVAIVSILAAKIPTRLITQLGVNPNYMKFLIEILKTKLTEFVNTLQPAQNGGVEGQQHPAATDFTLKFTLSALWNLTDESPSTCCCFVDQGGLKVVLDILDAFDHYNIQAKVLGLLNNVAEVNTLKMLLVDRRCLNHVKALLLCDRIDVSYFAAGILAHMCAGGATWQDVSPTWDDCLELLLNAIRSWPQPDSELVAYRSFLPFFPLLEKSQLPAVQYWALWAIHHVCSLNKERYVDMFKLEGGTRALDHLDCETLLKYPYIYELRNAVINLFI